MITDHIDEEQMAALWENVKHGPEDDIEQFKSPVELLSALSDPASAFAIIARLREKEARVRSHRNILIVFILFVAAAIWLR